MCLVLSIIGYHWQAGSLLDDSFLCPFCWLRHICICICTFIRICIWKFVFVRFINLSTVDYCQMILPLCPFYWMRRRHNSPHSTDSLSSSHPKSKHHIFIWSYLYIVRNLNITSSPQRETILYSDETKNTSKWLMALPQVHYYLAKPTQHMPRQWNFSRRIRNVQALCQWIQLGT